MIWFIWILKVIAIINYVDNTIDSIGYKIDKNDTIITVRYKTKGVKFHTKRKTLYFVVYLTKVSQESKKFSNYENVENGDQNLCWQVN
jgi:hypothetical protein